jgi:hypothetical protein
MNYSLTCPHYSKQTLLPDIAPHHLCTDRYRMWFMMNVQTLLQSPRRELPTTFRYLCCNCSQLILQSKVEVYKRETREIVRRFLRSQTAFADCITRLDAALVRFIPRMKQEQLDELRAVMLANNEAVMNEMGHRGREENADA